MVMNLTLKSNWNVIRFQYLPTTYNKSIIVSLQFPKYVPNRAVVKNETSFAFSFAAAETGDSSHRDALFIVQSNTDFLCQLLYVAICSFERELFLEDFSSKL